MSVKTLILSDGQFDTIISALDEAEEQALAEVEIFERDGEEQLAEDITRKAQRFAAMRSYLEQTN